MLLQVCTNAPTGVYEWSYKYVSIVLSTHTPGVPGSPVSPRGPSGPGKPWGPGSPAEFTLQRIMLVQVLYRVCNSTCNCKMTVDFRMIYIYRHIYVYIHIYVLCIYKYIYIYTWGQEVRDGLYASCVALRKEMETYFRRSSLVGPALRFRHAVREDRAGPVLMARRH
jgi:hypothetical protein